LKGGLAQLLALEGERAELGFDNCLLPLAGDQIAFDDTPSAQLQGNRGAKHRCGADQQKSDQPYDGSWTERGFATHA